MPNLPYWLQRRQLVAHEIAGQTESFVDDRIREWIFIQ